jgi:hypothetical protein
MPTHRLASSSLLLRVCIPLLLAAALLIPGCSGMFSGASEYEQAKQVEDEFAAKIAAAGGSAVRKGGRRGGFEANGWIIDLSGDTVTDGLIDAIIAKVKEGHNDVFELNFNGSTITNEQLAKLDEGTVLRKVFVLDLSNTGITDAGIDKLENVHVLEDLRVTGTKVSREAATRLGERKVKHPQTPKPFQVPPKITL